MTGQVGTTAVTEELRPLLDADGPFLSLYLRTPGHVENAGHILDTRWRNVRRDLLDQGVPEETLETVDPLVEGAHTRGPSLAVIAGVDGVLLAEPLGHELPRDAVTRFGPVPHLVPLLRDAQGQRPSIVVLTDRTGAELAAGVPRRPEWVTTVEGEVSPHITRSAPGGWSQPRYQNRAERLWQANATEVAEALTKLADEIGPSVVAVAGDVRAVQLLVEQLPERVSKLVHQIGGELADLDTAVERAGEVVREVAGAEGTALLARFREELGQRDRAVEGLDATVAALGKAQVETLLLDPDVVEAQGGGDAGGGRTAWFGEEATQLALDRAALDALGVTTPAEAPLTDVLVRAAIGTGATVHLLGRDPEGDRQGDRQGDLQGEGLEENLDRHREAGPRDGTGALLRWAERGDGAA